MTFLKCSRRKFEWSRSQIVRVVEFEEAAHLSGAKKVDLNLECK